MVCPTAVSKITYLQPKAFVKLWSSFLGSLFLNLLLHVLWVEHFFVQIKRTHLSSKWIFSSTNSTSVSCLRSLTLLELLAIESELIHLLLLLLHVLEVVLIAMW